MNPQDQIENPMEPWDCDEEERKREEKDLLAEAQIDEWMDKAYSKGEKKDES